MHVFSHDTYRVACYAWFELPVMLTIQDITACALYSLLLCTLLPLLFLHFDGLLNFTVFVFSLASHYILVLVF